MYTGLYWTIISGYRVQPPRCVELRTADPRVIIHFRSCHGQALGQGRCSYHISRPAKILAVFCLHFSDTHPMVVALPKIHMHDIKLPYNIVFLTFHAGTYVSRFFLLRSQDFSNQIKLKMTFVSPAGICFIHRPPTPCNHSYRLVTCRRPTHNHHHCTGGLF